MTTRARSPILVGVRLSTMPCCRRRFGRDDRERSWRARSSFCGALTTDGLLQRGRSTVGLSGLSIADCGRLVAGQVRGEALTSSRDGFSPPLMLRFAVDDLKAYYLEAGAAGAGQAVEPPARRLVLERDGGRCCASRDPCGLPGEQMTTG